MLQHVPGLSTPETERQSRRVWQCCAIVLPSLEGGGTGEFVTCGLLLVCKAQIEEISCKVMAEGRGCRIRGYQEGDYAHKAVRRAPAPELQLGFRLGHSFTLLMAEQQRSRSKVPEIGKYRAGKGRKQQFCVPSAPKCKGTKQSCIASSLIGCRVKPEARGQVPTASTSLSFLSQAKPSPLWLWSGRLTEQQKLCVLAFL